MDINKKTGKKKSPKTQYKATLSNIYALQIHNYKARIDTTVHRLHSVITNIQKDYRNFVTYDDETLVSIDIKNCQPYLMNLLFNPLFWQEGSEIPLNFFMLPPNIKSMMNLDLIIMIRSYVENLNEEVLAIYKEKASWGIMYEYIRDKANEEMGTTLEREDIKTMLFMVFFSKNEYFHQSGAILKRVFEGVFPEIYQLIQFIKSEDNAAFACILQSIESEIILHRCCKRIWEEGNQQVPIFTIHDSIVTTKEHQKFVEKIMQEELSRCIGISPTLRVEEWTEGKLKHQDILGQMNQM